MEKKNFLPYSPSMTVNQSWNQHLTIGQHAHSAQMLAVLGTVLHAGSHSMWLLQQHFTGLHPCDHHPAAVAAKTCQPGLSLR
jgi:hypothetical protein